MNAVKAMRSQSLKMQLESQTFQHQQGFMVVPMFSEGCDILKFK